MLGRCCAKHPIDPPRFLDSARATVLAGRSAPAHRGAPAKLSVAARPAVPVGRNAPAHRGVPARLSVAARSGVAARPGVAARSSVAARASVAANSNDSASSSDSSNPTWLRSIGWPRSSAWTNDCSRLRCDSSVPRPPGPAGTPSARGRRSWAPGVEVPCASSESLDPWSFQTPGTISMRWAPGGGVNVKSTDAGISVVHLRKRAA